METIKLNSAIFNFQTSKEKGKIEIFRNGNENISRINEAKINNITFKFKRLHEQDNKVGLLVNCKELRKVFSYVADIDKDVILALLDVKKLEHVYDAFNKISYKGCNVVVESGFGFSMKDTEKNWNLVSKFGYDAIEMCD